MNQVIKQINLDLYSSDFAEIIRTQQSDNLTRVIEIALLNQNENYSIASNTIVKIEGHRGDNSLFVKECTYSGNVVNFVLDSDVLLYAGTVKAKVVLYSSDQKEILSSTPFRIYVEEAPCDTNAEYESKKNLYNELHSDVQSIQSILTGKMHICGIRTITLSSAGVAADDTISLTGTFSNISKATGYLVVPYNMSYCTPQTTSVVNNMLSATLHNVTNSQKNISASFYILGYA